MSQATFSVISHRPVKDKVDISPPKVIQKAPKRLGIASILSTKSGSSYRMILEPVFNKKAGEVLAPL